MLNQMV
jgi:MFS superfamily sulfate permease-like transporter